MSFFSNLSVRGIPINPIIPMSQRDTINGNNDYSKSPSFRHRTHTNNNSSSDIPSTERIAPISKIVYSHSTNGLNNTDTIQQNTSDPFDLLSVNRQARPVFDIVTNSQYDNNVSINDDYDRKSRFSNSSHGDQQSISSPDKKRKQYLSTKLLKPFQNMRFRKKANAS